ncbi:MAG TPA: DUF6127 family protein [Vineibacter sp.]|nr:DUF6127 family protein [Vineibacter sp.]
MSARQHRRDVTALSVETGAAAPRLELRALLAEAADEGARRALARVGLHDSEALKDVVELRTLLDSWRALRRGALVAIGKIVTVGLLLALSWAVGAGKLKLW